MFYSEAKLNYLTMDFLYSNLVFHWYHCYTIDLIVYRINLVLHLVIAVMMIMELELSPVEEDDQNLALCIHEKR